MEQGVYIGIMMEKHKTREFRLHRGGQLKIYFDTQSNHNWYIEIYN